MKRFAVSAILAFFLLAPARRAAAEPVVIEHATLYVPSAAPLADATVVLDGPTIRAVGAQVAVPAGARHIDGHGKIVTPGFIDFAQTGTVEVEEEHAANDADPDGDSGMRPAFRLRDGYDPRSSRVPIARAGGVTSVVLAPDRGLLAGESALVDLAGARLAQAVVRDAVAETAMLDEGTLSAGGTGARGVAWQRLRAALDDARFYGAHKAAYDENRTRPLSLTRPHLEALQPVVRGEEPLVVYANRASDIELALRLADDYAPLKLVLAGATEAWLLASELAARKVPVILDPLADLPFGFDRLRVRPDLAATLARAGVPVMFFADAGDPVTLAWQRAGNAVRMGMDHDAAIRALTETVAATFGLRGYGRLEANAVANVVVWSGDPLETSSHVEHVFVRGEEQSLETRRTDLLRRYRTVPVVRDGSR
jgi:imidazolonepropionase-like amidohydrolase